MSDTADTGLRETILGALPEWMEDHVREKIAADLGEALDSRRQIGGNSPPSPIEGETEDDYLLRVDPEKLVVIEPDRLPALFAIHYPLLAARAVELLERCAQWRADHTTVKGGVVDIKGDAENAALADFIVQLDDFAKEVDEARKRVKLSVYNAGLQIDGWFTRGLSDPVMDIRGVTRTVSGKRYAPGPGTMQYLQSAYLNDKAERERLNRERIAKEAQEEADRKAEDARIAAQQEADRTKALQATGLDAEDAQALAEVSTDRAAEAADAAQQRSALIGSYAAEPARQVVRQHTASGTSIGLGGRWTFEVTSMTDLCLAVAGPALLRADLHERVAAAALMGQGAVGAVLSALAQILVPNVGAVPVGFLTTDDKVIRAAITARTTPLRECPGLRIYQDLSAQRRGAR